MKKKLIALFLALTVMVLGACGSQTENGDKTTTPGKEGETPTEQTTGGEDETTGQEGTEGKDDTSKMSGEINVVSREDGSGTRSAFVEITGVMKDDVDHTYEGAAIQSGTDEVMTYVAGDSRAIGYISLGSLNDTVKAVKVDGAEATPENITKGDYKVSRAFNIAYKKGEETDVMKDFISFMFAKEGQDLAADGYIAIDPSAAPYEKKEDLQGKINIQGSTSVAPLMEKIVEQYKKVQPNVEITLAATGSGAGITAAMEGNADIAMASRDLKDNEKEVLTPEEIARDGIAIIVSNENTTDDLSMDQLQKIFTGEIRNWEDL